MKPGLLEEPGEAFRPRPRNVTADCLFTVDRLVVAISRSSRRMAGYCESIPPAKRRVHHREVTVLCADLAENLRRVMLADVDGWVPVFEPNDTEDN